MPQRKRDIDANRSRGIQDFFRRSSDRPRESDDIIYDEIVVAPSSSSTLARQRKSPTSKIAPSHKPARVTGKQSHQQSRKSPVDALAATRQSGGGSSRPSIVNVVGPPLDHVEHTIDQGNICRVSPSTSSRIVPLQTTSPHVENNESVVPWPDHVSLTSSIVPAHSTSPLPLSASDAATDTESPVSSRSILDAPIGPLHTSKNLMAVKNVTSGTTSLDSQRTEKQPLCKDVTLSFSSFTSLSSVPTSTQSSSRRIVKDGLKGVTNSESEEGESSGEDLPDLHDFLPAKRRKLSSSPIEIEPPITGSALRPIRSSTRIPRVMTKHDDWTQLTPRKPLKFSLSKMAAQTKKRDQANSRIAAMEESLQDRGTSDEDDPPVSISHGERVVAQAAGSDADEQERILQALQRTEALQYSQDFRYICDDVPSLDDESFPVEALPDESVYEPLRSSTSRRHAFTTGYVRNLISNLPFGLAVTRWMSVQLLHEKDEALCEAYLETMRSNTTSIAFAETPTQLSAYYSIATTAQHKSHTQSLQTVPSGLVHIIRMLSFSAATCDRDETVPIRTMIAFLDLALLMIDENVQQDMILTMIITECIESMLDILSADAFDALVAKIGADLLQLSGLTRAHRCRLVTELPGGTQRAFAVRKRLALDVFYDQSKLPASNNHEHWPATIILALKTQPDLQISDTTDYKLLQSLMSVLEIAIGGGFIMYAGLVATGPGSSSSGLLRPQNVLSSEAVNSHNKQIDDFSSQLSAMAGRIRSAGTSHLARTEAKSAIERLIVCLEHSVRTKPKPRKSVFDVAGDRGSLTRFLESAGQRGMTHAQRVVDEQTRTSSDDDDDDSI